MAFPVAHTTTGQLVTAAQISEWADNMNLLKTTSDTHTTELAVLTVPIADDGSVVGPLKGYQESFQSVTIVAGVIAIDCALGNHVFVSLNANVTSITATNLALGNSIVPIVLYFTADGTPRTVTHSINGNVARFPGGTAPVMTSTVSKIDTIVYLYINGLGVLASIMGQNQ